MSVRWRLTLSFALVLAVAAIIAALFFYVAFQNWVISERIDTRLRVYSTALLTALSSGATDNVDYSLIRSNLASSGYAGSSEIWVQLADSGGSVLAKSDNLGDRDLPVVSGSSGIPVTPSGTRLRILPIYFESEGQTYQLAFAQSLDSVDPILSRMALTLLLVVLAFLVLATASAAILIRRALSPVKNVTATAQSIASSSDLSRRVNYHGPKDEIGELAATFDRMIEQLDGLLRLRGILWPMPPMS